MSVCTFQLNSSVIHQVLLWRQSSGMASQISDNSTVFQQLIETNVKHIIKAPLSCLFVMGFKWSQVESFCDEWLTNKNIYSIIITWARPKRNQSFKF